MKILIAPWSSPLPNGKTNAKNYPGWRGVVSRLAGRGHHTIQIGRTGEELVGAHEFLADLSLKGIMELAAGCDRWASVDSFLPHLVTRIKPGVVIFGKSDPLIFGYPENCNLLLDRRGLKEQQFQWWVDEPFDSGVFVGPDAVVDAVLK
jgi:hypothetical protein